THFHADQKYVTVHYCSGQDLIDESLKALEDEFADRFVRIHRKALVALDKIESLRKTADGRMEVVLRGRATAAPKDSSGDGQLVVSRRHLADVRRRLTGN